MAIPSVARAGIGSREANCEPLPVISLKAGSPSPGEYTTYLRHDLNARRDCCQIPHVLQILIGEGNATVGPIACLVIGDRFGEAIRLSVNKDISAGGLVQRGRSPQVRKAWVGNVQRLEVMAVLLAKIDDVAAFGGTKVPFALFSAGGTEAKRYAITAQRPILMK